MGIFKEQIQNEVCGQGKKHLKKQNLVTGNKGETLASEYLEKKGYKIIERNFRTRFGEIDIICRDAQTLVFVEVKTKIGHNFGEPEEMANRSKIGKVKRMGEVYLQDRGIESLCRVDVVAIVLSENGEVERLDHYENVY